MVGAPGMPCCDCLYSLCVAVVAWRLARYLCKIPDKTFRDVAGLEDILTDISKLVGTPLQHPEVFAHLGVKSLHGLLLQGPSGVGKTLLGDAIAGEMGFVCLYDCYRFFDEGLSNDAAIIDF